MEGGGDRCAVPVGVSHTFLTWEVSVWRSWRCRDQHIQSLLTVFKWFDLFFLIFEALFCAVKSHQNNLSHSELLPPDDSHLLNIRSSKTSDPTGNSNLSTDILRRNVKTYQREVKKWGEPVCNRAATQIRPWHPGIRAGPSEAQHVCEMKAELCSFNWMSRLVRRHLLWPVLLPAANQEAAPRLKLQTLDGRITWQNLDTKNTRRSMV